METSQPGRAELARLRLSADLNPAARVELTRAAGGPGAAPTRGARAFGTGI